MAYDIESFEKLGALFSLVDGIEADIPGKKDLDIIYKELERAIEDVWINRSKDLHVRLTSSFAQSGRKASILVREKLSEQWN
jgi:malonate decarboxylase beta subunit